MHWDEDFSQADYQHYWSLTAEECQRLLQDQQVNETLKALLLYQMGQRCWQQQDLNRAIAHFTEALTLRPIWRSVWVEQAAALLQLGDCEAAIESCDRALSLNGTDAAAWSLRGAALHELERYSEAIEACDRAVELDPEDASAWVILSQAQHRLGYYSKSVASYDHSLALQPDNPQAWGDRGKALQKLGRYEEAVLSYDKLLEAEPQNYRLWYARGLALRKLGRGAAAIASFQQALEIRPSFYAATRSKLFLLLTRGQWRSTRLVQRATLRNDLNNVLESFVKTKLPGLVVLAIVSFSSSHSRPLALGVATIFLLITIAKDLITESQR